MKFATKKVFRVYNGYTGFGAVHRIVVARR